MKSLLDFAFMAIIIGLIIAFPLPMIGLILLAGILGR
jgi:hypothetical protein